MTTPFEQKLNAILEPSLVSMGYDLVRVMMRGDQRKTLQVMAERHDQIAMTLEDCEKVSETVSALLDVHDPIKERYALEVSSPGIDRPLMKVADFARFAGFEAKIDLKDLYENRRKAQGILRDVDGQNIKIELEKGEIFAVPFDMIARAKLILTDALIDAHLKEQEKIQPINQDPVSIETDDHTNED